MNNAEIRIRQTIPILQTVAAPVPRVISKSVHGAYCRAAANHPPFFDADIQMTMGDEGAGVAVRSVYSALDSSDEHVMSAWQTVVLVGKITRPVPTYYQYNG